jgi:hypothetical protein
MANYQLREKLAALEHQQWSHWTKYLIDSGLITDAAKIAHWERQINTPYYELTEAEKDLDRKWADKVIEILNDNRQQGMDN